MLKIYVIKISQVFKMKNQNSFNKAAEEYSIVETTLSCKLNETWTNINQNTKKLCNAKFNKSTLSINNISNINLFLIYQTRIQRVK
jgi:hypothetical protein